MSFLQLVAHNLRMKLLRSTLTGLAVAVAVMTVVTLSVVGHSLQRTAAAVLKVGNADFFVAQKGVANITSSKINQEAVAKIGAMPGVKSAVGFLVVINPKLLEVGVPPAQLGAFGVHVVAGQPYAASAPNQLMLGWRAAQNLSKSVGDTITIDRTYTITGIYSVNPFADTGALLPLSSLQNIAGKQGVVTLIAVLTEPGANTAAIRSEIEQRNAQFTTLKTASELGRADRNLVLIGAIETGSTILALAIGVIIVMNTMLLSFVERVREFGILSAIGWSRKRVAGLVFAEALAIAIVGAAIGLALSVLVVLVLQHVGRLAGILHADYTAAIFAEAIYASIGMAVIGALYPAARASLVRPLRALSRE